MKRYISIIILLLLFAKMSVAQISLSLGSDTTFCVTENRNHIGENISLTAGIPPYTYTWSGEIQISASGEMLPASAFLSDTTAMDPYFTITGIGRVWNSLYLTVEDSNQAKATEKIRVRFSKQYAMPAMEEPILIQLGDSVRFDLSATDLGGILPYSHFAWEPQEGLTAPDSPITWCKTDKEIRYTCYMTDSVGCVMESAVYWVIPYTSAISTISEEANIHQLGQTIYFKNPNKEEVILLFYSLDGSLIHQDKTTADFYLPILDKKGATYLCVVYLNGKKHTLKYLF
ncbi:hypothetical protein LJB91_00150 [Bacteroidales bacterium OttesenSCG-928-L03]|nr:hypothetical protein [Bacteroidales bacterium OttesenSCG-928-L03]